MQNNPSNEFEIRCLQPADRNALASLYPSAFPDEDLAPLIDDLLNEDKEVVFSLVAIDDHKVVGHIAFTMCEISGQIEKVCMLAPLAVSPPFQRQGIGSALIAAGIEHLKEIGATRLFVLGDPGYYGRFGFAVEHNIAPPYDLPVEWQTAWQSINLKDLTSDHKGKLLVPEAWRKPKLWLP